MANSNDKRGFASMDEEKQREVASKGGHAARKSGHAHKFDSEEAGAAGQKGGEAASTWRRSGRRVAKAAGSLLA